MRCVTSASHGAVIVCSGHTTGLVKHAWAVRGRVYHMSPGACKNNVTLSLQQRTAVVQRVGGTIRWARASCLCARMGHPHAPLFGTGLQCARKPSLAVLPRAQTPPFYPGTRVKEIRSSERATRPSERTGVGRACRRLVSATLLLSACCLRLLRAARRGSNFYSLYTSLQKT